MTEVLFQEIQFVARTVRVPDDVVKQRDKLLSEHCCLGCKVRQEKGATIRRGLCNSCYMAFTRHKKKVSQTELIREGRLMPVSSPGRKPVNSFAKELRDR